MEFGYQNCSILIVDMLRLIIFNLVFRHWAVLNSVNSYIAYVKKPDIGVWFAYESCFQQWYAP